MNDDATLSLRGSESDLRESPFDQPSLVEDGLRPRGREHETPVGPIDVRGSDDDGLITFDATGQQLSAAPLPSLLVDVPTSDSGDSRHGVDVSSCETPLSGLLLFGGQ